MPGPRRPSRVSQVTIGDGELEKAIQVQDGGKAWLLVAAAFVCQMLCAGLIQSMGVTFVELKRYFGATDTEISWVGSCLTFSACAMSVLSGALSRQFGCRPTVIFGGMLAFLATGAGSFCQTLWQLYITVSLTGSGCGLALPAAISVIGFNFQVRFGVANGLQYAGVGVGIMAIPPLFQLMFDSYSWRGALLIYSAVLLNVVACGILMKPSAAERYSLRTHHTKGTSVIPHKTQKESQRLMDVKENKDLTGNVKETRVDLQTPEMYAESDKSKCRTSATCDIDEIITTELQPDAAGKSGKMTELKAVRIKEPSLLKKASHILGISILWQRPNFACFAIAVVMFGFGYASCLTYFIPRAIQDVKIPELQASFLLTMLGANSLAARLTNGPIVDYGWISPLRFFCLSCLVCAISSLCTPFTHSFGGSLVCAGLFGLASGVANPMLAMVSRELVGQKVMASAVGLLMLGNGIGSVVGIYTMGFMFDHLGNYDLSFYIAGCDLLLLIMVVYTGKALTKKSAARKTSASSVTKKDGASERSQPIRDSAGSSNQKPVWNSLHQSPSKSTTVCIESSV